MNNYRQINFGELELNELLDYVVNKHHAYCKQMLIVIHNHFKTGLIESKENNVCTKSISKHLVDFANILEHHFRKEEHIIFPFIKKILKAKRNNKRSLLSQVPWIENPLNVLQTEHKKLVSLLLIIINNTHQYFIQKINSAILKLCYNDLSEFENELHKYIFIEEKFLFPKVLELQKKMIQTTKATRSEKVKY